MIDYPTTLHHPFWFFLFFWLRFFASSFFSYSIRKKKSILIFLPPCAVLSLAPLYCLYDMMAEDWDLFAIVQSCQSATKTAATTEENPLTTTNTIPSPRSISTCTVKEERLEYEMRFSFPNSNNSNSTMQPTKTNELQELATTSSGPAGINLNGPHPQAASTSSNINKFHDQVQQQQQFHVPQSNSATVVVQHQQHVTPRLRKRESQQGKMVCHVTADNLSADLWAWRKYRQKPIKGSVTDAAAPKVVMHESKLNRATLKPTCLSLHTPETTRIPDPPTEIHLQEVAVTSLWQCILPLPLHSPHDPTPQLLRPLQQPTCWKTNLPKTEVDLTWKFEGQSNLIVKTS